MLSSLEYKVISSRSCNPSTPECCADMAYSSSLLSIPSLDVSSQQFLKPGSDIQCEKCYSKDETHITVLTVFSVCTGDTLHTEEGHLQ